jgi:hypothetical protein
MANADSTNNLTLDESTRRTIINALLIGLESYGEVDRLTEAADVAEHLDNGLKIPDTLRPIHPTGSSDTIGMFTSALRALHA